MSSDSLNDQCILLLPVCPRRSWSGQHAIAMRSCGVQSILHYRLFEGSLSSHSIRWLDPLRETSIATIFHELRRVCTAMTDALEELVEVSDLSESVSLGSNSCFWAFWLLRALPSSR